MRPARALLALLVVSLLAACGPRMVTSQVTRFHALPPGFAGESFTILPEQGQVGSLEFQSYADLVAAQLQARGLTPVPASEKADYVVYLDYGIGPPRTIVGTRPSPFYGSFGYGFGSRRHRDRWGYGLGVGFPFGPFGPYETYAVTRYDRWLEVEMLDAGALRAGKPVHVFEGRAISEGSSASLPQVMPYLAAALFENFPGMSGQTVRVAVPVPGT